MNLIPIVRCSKELDFAPRQRWPDALPAMAWKGYLLTGFEREQGSAVDLGNDDLPLSLQAALKACYPELGLGERLRLRDRLNNIDPKSADPAIPLEWARAIPRRFMDWLDDRKVGLRELAILKSIGDLAAFSPLLTTLAEAGLSRGLGIQILELAGELFLMGRPLSELLSGGLSGGLSGEKWLDHLQSLRRPVSRERDRSKSEIIDALPWPAHIRAEWKRWGDEAGLELHLRASSPEELATRIENLSRVREIVSQASDLWRP